MKRYVLKYVFRDEEKEKECLKMLTSLPLYIDKRIKVSDIFDMFNNCYNVFVECNYKTDYNAVIYFYNQWEQEREIKA